MRRLRVSSRDAGSRADVFVTKKYRSFSRSALSRLFDMGFVTVNKLPLKAGSRLRPGDSLKIDDKLLQPSAHSIELPVIYQDDDVLVIDKPSGVLTHSKGALNDEATVASFIRPFLSGFEDNNRAGIVHRLDRATSGVIITARHPAAQAWLQKQFSKRQVFKTYLAIVSDQPDPGRAIIDIPLARNPKQPQTFKADGGGKSAITEYKLVNSWTDKQGRAYSVLELQPRTGRTHQLRVHMSYIGHPILGDRLYGGFSAEHFYLHAKELKLKLPSGKEIAFSAPTPDYFQKFTDQT